ncbi:MAG: L,D-transpeptidase [Bacteroidota bacterium]
MSKFFGWFLLYSLLFSFFLTNCQKTEEIVLTEAQKQELIKKKQDSLDKAEIAKYDVFPKIKYNKVFLPDGKSFARILSKYRDPNGKFDHSKILATLNRKELRFFYRSDSIIVPDTIIPDLRAYSVFPQFYPGARNIKKLVIVSAKLQAYACFENGKQIRFVATNTGKERTQTYPGRYALEWKEMVHKSSLDSNWLMPYNYNFHVIAGNAFHQFVMPGRPVSHSCCRQFLDDAKWLFYWGEGPKFDKQKKKIPMSGTPVVIMDFFDFSRKKGGPWLDLTSNKDSILKLPEDPMAVEEALIPWCQIPDASKGSVKNKPRFIYAEDTLRARGVIRPGVKLIETVDYNKLRREKARKQAITKPKEEHKPKNEQNKPHNPTIQQTKQVHENKNTPR